MSQREDQIRTAVIPALAGINERASKTDLQPQESTFIEGTFPNITGQQAKIPGKYLLALFEESVYGIHQMWTPYGYGTNIYQFDGTVGSDPWITPPGKPIKPDPLPPSPAGPDGVVIDETGSYPENPGVFPPPLGGIGGNGTSSTPTGPTPGGGPPPDPPEPLPTYRPRMWFTQWPESVGAPLINFTGYVEILRFVFTINASAAPDGPYYITTNGTGGSQLIPFNVISGSTTEEEYVAEFSPNAPPLYFDTVTTLDFHLINAADVFSPNHVPAGTMQRLKVGEIDVPKFPDQYTYIPIPISLTW